MSSSVNPTKPSFLRQIGNVVAGAVETVGGAFGGVPWTFPSDDSFISHMSVQAIVNELSASTTVTFFIFNSSKTSIEGTLLFPLDNKACVNSFMLAIDGRHCLGKAMPNMSAEEEYGKAIKSGRVATTVQKPHPSVFKLQIGNLRPQEKAVVTLTYSNVLSVEDFKGRFYFPTTMKPKFVVGNVSTELSNIDFKSKDSKRLPVSMNIIFDMDSKIKNIICKSQEIIVTDMTSVDGEIIETKRSVYISDLEMDRDFVCLIETEDHHFARVTREDTGNGTAMMLSILPKFELKKIKSEIIFLVDRSGSMDEDMPHLQRACHLFLTSLPVDCYFNIFSFNTGFQQLFPKSQKYDDDSLQKAKNFVDELVAYGGTVLLNPLEKIFQQNTIDGFFRQVIVLTDGAVKETDTILDLVGKHQNTARVHSVGLGSSADHHLVDGLAKRGRGMSRYIMHDAEDDEISKVLMEMLKNATQECYEDVKVEWGYVAQNMSNLRNAVTIVHGIDKTGSLNEHGFPLQVAGGGAPTFIQAPSNDKIPFIASGDPFVVFAFFPKGTTVPECVKVTATHGQKKPSLTINQIHKKEVVGYGVITPLVIQQIINQLQDNMDPEAKTKNTDEEKKTFLQQTENIITFLACNFNVLSKFTSFVAVDSEGNPDKEAVLNMVKKKMKLEAPAGYNSRQSQGSISFESDCCYDSAPRNPTFSFFSARKNSKDEKPEQKKLKVNDSSEILDSLRNVFNFEGKLKKKKDLAIIFGKPIDFIENHVLDSEKDLWMTAIALELIKKLVSNESEGMWRMLIEKIENYLQDYSTDAAKTFVEEHFKTV